MSDDPAQRPAPGSDDFDPKQHVWDGREWWTADHQYWWDGTKWQPHDAPHESGLPMGAAQSAPRPRPPGYRRDFWLGFVGVVAGNIVLSIVLNVISGQNLGGSATSLVVAAPWVLNIGALVAFAIIRPRVAVGMLLGYGVALGITLLAGLFLLVLCFGGRP